MPFKVDSFEYPSQFATVFCCLRIISCIKKANADSFLVSVGQKYIYLYVHSIHNVIRIQIQRMSDEEGSSTMETSHNRAHQAEQWRRLAEKKRAGFSY